MRILAPASEILEKANQNLDNQERVAEIYRRRRAVIGNIDRAQKIIRSNIRIPDYAAADGEKMGVTVIHHESSPGSGRPSELHIGGLLARTKGGMEAAFPMYKVTKEIPASDTMSSPARYEILVADPSSETGYSPLALVAGRKTDYSFGGRFGNEQPTSDQQEQFNSQGFYVDPRGETMLAEVHSILGMAIDQQTAAQAA